MSLTPSPVEDGGALCEACRRPLTLVFGLDEDEDRPLSRGRCDSASCPRFNYIVSRVERPASLVGDSSEAIGDARRWCESRPSGDWMLNGAKDSVARALDALESSLRSAQARAEELTHLLEYQAPIVSLAKSEELQDGVSSGVEIEFDDQIAILCSHEALRVQLAASRAREQEAQKGLRWALAELEDAMPGECPIHLCEFTHDPEKGHCGFHESWAAARQALPEGFATRSPASEDATP